MKLFPFQFLQVVPLLLLLTLSSQPSLGQDTIDSAEQATMWVNVEQMPEFPGGEVALMKWLNQNMPPWSESQFVASTKFYVSFVVGKDGFVKDPKLLRKEDWDDPYAIELLSIFEKMPRWTPGKKLGKPVDVIYRLPVQIELR